MQAGGEGVEHAERECGVLSPPSFMGPAGRNGLGSQVVAKDVMQITGGSLLEGARQPTQFGLGASGVGQTPESRAMTTLLQSGEEQVQDSGPRQSEASYEEPEEGSYTPLFRSRYGHGPDTSPETLESVSSGQAAAASYDDGNVEGRRQEPLAGVDAGERTHLFGPLDHEDFLAEDLGDASAQHERVHSQRSSPVLRQTEDDATDTGTIPSADQGRRDPWTANEASKRGTQVGLLPMEVSGRDMELQAVAGAHRMHAQTYGPPADEHKERLKAAMMKHEQGLAREQAARAEERARQELGQDDKEEVSDPGPSHSGGGPGERRRQIEARQRQLMHESTIRVAPLRVEVADRGGFRAEEITSMQGDGYEPVGAPLPEDLVQQAGASVERAAVGEAGVRGKTMPEMHAGGGMARTLVGGLHVMDEVPGKGGVAPVPVTFMTHQMQELDARVGAQYVNMNQRCCWQARGLTL